MRRPSKSLLTAHTAKATPVGGGQSRAINVDAMDMDMIDSHLAELE